MSRLRIKSNSIFSAPEQYAYRQYDEQPPSMRSEFQRDRDRILYSKSFRRLSGKTQVFLTRTHDHIRNRLTHSLEVSQIASTTSKMLGLNQELTEAISLGHDIGHTPFGHVGERTLNYIMNNCIEIKPSNQLLTGERGFKHNLQGVRVFSDLHSIYPDMQGTNLTNFTLYGIVKHSRQSCKSCKAFYNKKCYIKSREYVACDGNLHLDFYSKYHSILRLKNENIKAWSFEADVVEQADEIAQRHHDVEDAIFMNTLEPSDIIIKIKECFSNILSQRDVNKLGLLSNDTPFFLSLVSQFLVHLYNENLIAESKSNLEKFAKLVGISKRSDFIQNYSAYDPLYTKDIIKFSDEFRKADECFKKFIGSAILNSNRAQRMDGKGSFIIEKLFKAYFTNPRQLHDSTVVAVFNVFESSNLSIEGIGKIQLGEYRNKIDDPSNRSDPKFEKALMRCICDHIAGMTDNFVVEEYSRLYGDKPV